MLIGWLIAAQLPRWTAPQPNWFAANTPGVCAAVSSLAIYSAARGDPNAGIGRQGAQSYALQVVAEHYGITALHLSEPLAVQATLPSEERHAYFVVTARLSDDTPPTAAVIYLDATTGEPRALITATEDLTQTCDFDLRGALLAALRSPPPLLLGVYVLTAAGALAVWKIRGRLR